DAYSYLTFSLKPLLSHCLYLSFLPFNTFFSHFLFLASLPSSYHKNNERAFFDSADWALCKQGAGVNQQSTTAVETLRPKLQRTPHQQLPPRRPACTSG
ncbi:hypothetical protein glysoja_029435, partial [Glycine soja]